MFLDKCHRLNFDRLSAIDLFHFYVFIVLWQSLFFHISLLTPVMSTMFVRLYFSLCWPHIKLSSLFLFCDTFFLKVKA